MVSRWRELRDGAVMPEPGPPPRAAESPWRVYGNKLVHERQDLVLLAGVDAPQRARLRAAGIHRVDELWRRPPEEVNDLLGPHHGAVAYHTAQSYRTRAPIAKPGHELRIPRAERRLYFAFGTSDDVHPTMPPHVYLIGCRDGATRQCVEFFARGAGEEPEIFDAFIDYVGDDVERSRLYHWTDYEITQMQAVMLRWPRLAGPLTRLMGSCVDLKQCIQDAVYLPVPRFSLASVAPALGFNRRQSGFGVIESMLCYWDYLDTGNRDMVKKAVRRNRDDCLAMWARGPETDRRCMKDQGRCEISVRAAAGPHLRPAGRYLCVWDKNDVRSTNRVLHRFPLCRVGSFRSWTAFSFTGTTPTSSMKRNASLKSARRVLTPVTGCASISRTCCVWHTPTAI